MCVWGILELKAMVRLAATGKTTLATALCVLAASFLWSPGSQAATCMDPAGDGSVPSIVNNVSGTSACTLGSTNNDKFNQNLEQVNVDAIFGFSDWQFLGKEDPPDAGADNLSVLDLDITSGGTATLAGSWSIVSNAFTNFFGEIMLVFVDGKDVPDVYVAYLLDATSGTFTSPFTNTTPDPDQPKEISHISLYARGQPGPVGAPAPVPLPAALPLLAGGLGLLGLLGWRRRRFADA